MRPTPEALVCRLGHTATTAELLRAGETARSIAWGVRTGAIRRAVHGVYVCSHADAQQLGAVRHHARVDCVSALRQAGVWAGFDDRLHVHIDPHASRVRVVSSPPRTLEQLLSPQKNQPHEDHLAVHRSRLADGPTSVSVVSPRDALLHSIQCLDEEHAIAALESAVHEGFITEAGLAEVCARAPGRLAAGIAEMELTSHSGYETIVRRRLRHAGFSVVAQGYIPGVGHQGLVVEDLVGVETDGQFWHNTAKQFRVDHDRDVRSMALGRGVIRLTQSEIFLHWETSLLAIERAVADARDLRRFRGRG